MTIRTSAVSVSYSIELFAEDGAAADGVATNTVAATLKETDVYVNDTSLLFTVTGGSAIFPGSTTTSQKTITLTTNNQGEASAVLTDTVEETVTIEAILIEDTSVTAEATSTFGSGDDGGSLPAPTVTEAVNGTLTYLLTQAHVTVPTTTLTVGDTVLLTWRGTLSDGTAAADYTPNNTVTSVSQDLPFTIASSYIAPLVGGSVDVSYTDITTGDESEVLHLDVTGSDSSWLAAPVVVEASGSSLSSSVSQASVNIAPYTGMTAGDIVSLDWDGNVTGKYPLTQTVSGNTAGTTLTFSVPAAQIKNNETVGLNYTVEPASSGGLLVSWPLGLNII